MSAVLPAVPAATTEFSVQEIVHSVATQSTATSLGALALGSSIGLLGGALYGSMRSLSSFGLAWIRRQYLSFEAMPPQYKLAAQIAAVVAIIFISSVLTWAAFKACGFSFEIKQALTFTAIAVLGTGPIAILWSAAFPRTRTG